MNRTNANEPAHPCPEGRDGFKGLTKREYMATTIMQGLSASFPGASSEVLAKDAVSAADALITALNA